MTIDTRTREILSNIEILDGNKTRITETLTPKEYKKVNEVLETYGGKWSRKDKAHVWTCSPDEALKMFISGGDTETASSLSIETKAEKKKSFQFFATPAAVADELVSHAEYIFPYEAPQTILEPSAGTGAIIQAVHRKWPHKIVSAYELMPENRTVLEGISDCNILGDDFLKHDTKQKFDCIVMNPPFKSHQDIEHVKKAYDTLEDGGALISITSNHWRFASHKIDKEFKAWLEEVDAEVNDIEPGSFKDSGTMVAANFVVIRK